ncbi:MAG: PDZ domain-containing protein [Bacteroidota bacterium]
MKTKAARINLITLLLLTTVLTTKGKDIHVAPTGSQTGEGTRVNPFGTIKQAQLYARSFVGKEPVTIYLSDGIYYLGETLEFTPKDSGNKEFPVYYKALNQGKAILSGGQKLTLKWKTYKNGIWVAKVKGDLDIDQLFVNGIRRDMARYPNSVAGKNVFNKWDLRHSWKDQEKGNKAEKGSDALSPERIAPWKNPEGAYVHAMHAYLWGDMHWLVKGKDANGELILEGGWQNNRPSPMHKKYRFVENVFEELDAPGEWFFDKRSGKLYYYPLSGTDLEKATVEVVSLRHLIEFNGSREQSVHHVNLAGLTFKHAARVFMDNKEQLLRSDWTVYRGGAVLFNGAEYCTVSRCEFDQVGGNGIFVNNYNRFIDISSCYIHHSGANGVAFVGDPDMVRSPVFRYGPQDYENLDLTPGPKGDNYPANCRVYDCIITKTGRDEKQTAPVQISMSFGINVSHCSIYDVPRAGINVSEGTFGGHVIENCDVFNTVLETGDHGSFNSWGRDRFWDPSNANVDREVAKNPRLPFLDMIEPNILRHNRWRCDHGWDVDLDDGSSYYRIYNNVLLNGGLKLREGFNRLVTNNVIVNNSFHPHVWYKESGDIFKNNIVFTHYMPAAMTRNMTIDEKWGETLDHNLFTSNNIDRLKFAINGADTNSIVADPLFLDPEQGDFRVEFTSAALGLGFENFTMDNVGVVSPYLRAIAKTPVIPQIKIAPDTTPVEMENPKDLVFWWESRIEEPKADELSAYGVDFGMRGVAITFAPKHKKAWSLGLRTGDFITQVDGTAVSDMDSFLKTMGKKKKQNVVTFTLFRNQKPMTLEVKTKE